MNRILSFMIGLAFIFSGETDGDIGFRYGFLSKPSYESNDITVLSDSSIIHTGDLLKINIGYVNRTNFSIVYQDASGEYVSLFSSDDAKDSNQDTIYASALLWAEMEKPPGIETFYFINTSESIKGLSIPPTTVLSSIINNEFSGIYSYRVGGCSPGLRPDKYLE